MSTATETVEVRQNLPLIIPNSIPAFSGDEIIIPFQYPIGKTEFTDDEHIEYKILNNSNNRIAYGEIPKENIIGLNLNINKIAFSIGNIDIYWYALIIVCAIIVAIFICKKNNGKYGIKFENVLELLVFVIPISIIAARIYYVVFNLDYYSKNILEILNIKKNKDMV